MVDDGANLRRHARGLVVCTPSAGIDQMFMDMDAAGHRTSGPPSMQEIFAIAARAGVDIARKPDALLG
ncbi:MAG: hypothetical protein ACAH24_19605 [Hyphomicrobiaceae bacterium]